jgi:hypothetical protein
VAGATTTAIDFHLQSGEFLTPSVITLGDALTGVPFVQQLFTTGGSGPYRYAVTRGVLPPGLSLDAATGAFVGSPAAVGRFDFVVTTYDTSGVAVSHAKDYSIDPSSRFNIWVELEEIPAGAGQFPLLDTAVSVTIASINGGPVIVERGMWWPGPAWAEAHNSTGSTQAGTRWAIADGEVGGARDVETYLLIANTSAFEGLAKVTLYFEDGTTAEQAFPLQRHSRLNVVPALHFSSSFPTGRRFGAVVQSLGDTPAQIVVERATYWTAMGQFWAAGNALATRPQ